MFRLIDNEIREPYFNEIQSKTLDELKKEEKEFNDTLVTALEQAGDEYDLTKIEVVGGTTPKEKSDKLVEVHSKLSAVQDAMVIKNELSESSRKIRQRNSGASDKDAEPPLTFSELQQAMLTGQGKNLFDHFKETIAEAGVEISKKLLKNNSGFTMDMGREILNTLFKTSAGWAPFVQREGTLILSAQRPIQVLDIIPTMPTSQSAIKYMEETTFANAAVEVAEGGAAPEAQLALTERTVNVQKLAVSLPVTEEQVDDVDEVEMYLNQRIPFMLRQRADHQVLLGDGAAPNLQGILDHATVQEQVFTKEAGNGIRPITKPLNAFMKAKTKVALVGRAMPSAAIMHHSMWESLALQETASAGFYMGSPAGDFQMRIWGLPVVLADTLSVAASGDAGIVGDFTNFCSLRVRKDFELDFGWSADDFLKGQMRIRGCARLAMITYRPPAFCKVSLPATSKLPD